MGELGRRHAQGAAHWLARSAQPYVQVVKHVGVVEREERICAQTRTAFCIALAPWMSADGGQARTSCRNAPLRTSCDTPVHEIEGVGMRFTDMEVAWDASAA